MHGLSWCIWPPTAWQSLGHVMIPRIHYIQRRCIVQNQNGTDFMIFVSERTRLYTVSNKGVLSMILGLRCDDERTQEGTLGTTADCAETCIKNEPSLCLFRRSRS